MRIGFNMLTLGFVALPLALAGCTEKTSTNAPTPTAESGTDEHAHPSEGPHHGELIELGDEQYHAELVDDEEAGTVTIYVLDGAATKQVPIDATEITINATHDGKPKQFTLTASADESDPDGKSSRFVSDDKELLSHLHEEDSNAQLVLTIDGKSYRGAIKHEHNHGPDHEHE